MVKRDPALIPLSDEHFSHLLFAKRLREGRPEKVKSNWPDYSNDNVLINRTKDYFSIDMLHHFDLEEKVVFPVYELYLKEGTEEKELLDYIKSNHQSIKAEITSLDSLKGEALYNKLKEIGTYIEQHIRKEERKLFEDIQKRISTDELIEIGKVLKAKAILKCSNFL